MRERQERTEKEYKKKRNMERNNMIVIKMKFLI